ncbi:MAG: YcgL domain-containing protein [Alteromonas sp.]
MSTLSLLCSVYKTRKKDGMFLYIPEVDNFDAVPKVLMERFGQPQLVMHIPQKTTKTLHSVSKEALIDAFERDGFYLQMPPQQENWLAEHRESLGLAPEPPKADY